MELNKHGITAIAETVAVAYRRSLALCVFMLGWSVEELRTSELKLMMVMILECACQSENQRLFSVSADVVVSVFVG